MDKSTVPEITKVWLERETLYDFYQRWKKELANCRLCQPVVGVPAIHFVTYQLKESE